MINKLEDLSPMGDYIVVTEFHARTESIIVLPGKKKTDNTLFEVMAVGPGRRTDFGKVLDMRLKVGDIIIFTSDTPCLPLHVAKENRLFYLLNEGNVVAKAGNVATTPRAIDPHLAVREDLTRNGHPSILKA